MVIGLLAIASIPTIIGVGQAVSAQKKQNATAKESAKFSLTAELSIDRSSPQEAFLVLLDGRGKMNKMNKVNTMEDQRKNATYVLGMLYVDHPDCPVQGHRFDGYYFKYPGDEGHKGLVSTIADDPPMLNWIFVDATTRAARYGSRKDSMGNVIGPWGWSEDEQHLILHGSSDGFIVVRERERERAEGGVGHDRANASQVRVEERTCSSGTGHGSLRWAVYWDPDGELRRRKKRREWREIRLRRRMKLGMESRYVKAGD